jgi:phosphoribosylanthranilate isomerase
MKIETVTFTGADESVKPEDILRVVEDYPNVSTEWGLLLSKANEGKRPRFPSKDWMLDFSKQAQYVNTKVAGHLQGRWLESLFDDPPDGFLRSRGELLEYLTRLQLNFHSNPPNDFPNHWREMMYFLNLLKKQFIFQMDGISDHLYHKAAGQDLICYPLFDRSAGQGVVPDSWPKPLHPKLNGYAGGLGPENIKEQLKRIEDVVGDGTIWIDMETKIRSEDDSKFLLDKCRAVLEVVALQS